MEPDPITLRDYVDTRFRFVEKSTETAYAAMDKRLEGMNEFRDTLKDQAARFITREELNGIVGKIEADIRVLTISKALLEGKASQASAYGAMVLAILGVLIGLASYFVK